MKTKVILVNLLTDLNEMNNSVKDKISKVLNMDWLKIISLSNLWDLAWPDRTIPRNNQPWQANQPACCTSMTFSVMN